MVAALHDESYGVAMVESLEEKLKKKVNISAVHVALKRIENKGFVKSRFGGITEDRGGRQTISYEPIKASSANPVNCLRSE